MTSLPDIRTDLPCKAIAWRLIADGATVSSSVTQYSFKLYPSQTMPAFLHRPHSGRMQSHFTFRARHVQHLSELRPWSATDEAKRIDARSGRSGERSSDLPCESLGLRLGLSGSPFRRCHDSSKEWKSKKRQFKWSRVMVLPRTQSQLRSRFRRRHWGRCIGMDNQLQIENIQAS